MAGFGLPPRPWQGDAPVGAGERPQLAVERSDPLVEQLDHRERLGHGAAPDLGHTARLEQLHRVGFEERESGVD